ncbi:uncharacterized protein LOC135845271 [Planococcus citri]|uniref:uncharacterized protein LOC135845271 n=1 Tax=Planococcus citri TaxID=170843 RepID=UPI0031F75690
MSTIDLYTEDRLVYQFYPVQANYVNFKIKAPHDAHIALTSTPYESKPMYEVFFGGWKNTKSVIRKDQTQPDVVEVPTPNLLNPNEYKSFWIKWEYGTLSAGVQGDFRPLMSWQDSAMFPIQYFGVCTGWGASGHWIIENSPPSFIPGYPQQPPPNPNMPYPAPIPGQAPGFNPPPFQPPNPMYPQIPPAGVPPYQPHHHHHHPTTAPRWVPSNNGSFPPNAVVAGADVSGELIYVIRAQHEGALIPGKLVPSHRAAYVAWGGRENPKDSYEVLCDCTPSWVHVTGSQIPPNAFEGGRSENGERLFIGRSQHEGSTTPGKVQPSHGVCYIPFGGQEVAKQQYEILTI